MKAKNLKTDTKKHYSCIIFLIITILLIFANSQLMARSFCSTSTKLSKQKLRQTNRLSYKIEQEAYHLKIYIHVIRNANGTLGYTASDVDETISYLDAAFNPSEIYFVWDKTINFIDDEKWSLGPGYHYSNNDIFEVNNHSDGIDIYLFPETAFRGGGQANGVGESSEFWVSGSIDGNAAAKSYVTAHEMGHVLNLWHTHHSCETNNWEATDGSNCAIAGDYICDTPADPDMDFRVDPENCIWQDIAYCLTPEAIEAYNPDTRNIMSYSHINCYEYFSPEQGERMRDAIASLPYLQATLTNTNSNLTGCNVTDWNALKTLYEKTGGEMWTINTNWDILKQDSISEHCSLRGLYGITFNASGRVTGINLYNNNLTGALPAEIGNLSDLKYLDVGFNALIDTIPSQIGNLTQLEILYLDHNKFNGNIPISLTNLNLLAQLRLTDNLLSGCISVEFGIWCDKIAANAFSIDKNNSFDASFENFCNNATGTCPIERCNTNDWLALKQIYQSTNGNNWSDNLNWDMVDANLPPANCDLRKLRGVALDLNSRVMAIDLFDNNLTGNLPNEIGNLTALTYIDFGFNHINNTIPPSITNLGKLNTLLLDNNELSGNFPAYLADIASLAFLQLNDNDFNGCFDANLSKLCTQLNDSCNKNKYISDGNSLNLTWEAFCAGNPDSCGPSSCYQEWYALKQLYLNTKGDDWFDNTGWEIVLEDNPPPVCDFSGLNGITVDENNNVIEILLNFNNLIGTIPPELGHLTKLVSLNLWSNILTGEIPAELGNLTNLQTLDLAENFLNGSIPGTLGNLSNLNYLFLYSNNLTGCYSENLSNLCPQLINELVSHDTELDTNWSDFCKDNIGVCNNASICNSEAELDLNGIHQEPSIYVSSNHIYSSAIVKASTSYAAGQNIELKTGFEVDDTVDFNAKIQQCE